MIEYPKPWLPPLLKGPLRSFFLNRGEKCVYKKGEVIVEEDYLQRFILLKSGMLGNFIANYDLNKPFTGCGIRIPWQITGYTTFLVGEPAPLYINALVKSEVYIVPFPEMRAFLAKEPELKDEFMRICARCLRSDLDALLAITTTAAEERLWILFAAFVMAFGLDVSGEWVSMPYKFNRSTVSGLLYVTLLTVDRLYAQLTKQGMIKRENGILLCRSSCIKEGISWIMKRHAS